MWLAASIRGFSEWLARHLAVGYQRDNNVWRQAGAMYVLLKNNCYPFKSHFLIGLAVVEGNLERRQVRERLREREGERVRRRDAEEGGGEKKLSCRQLCMCVVGVSVGVVESSPPSLHLCFPGSSSHGSTLHPGDISKSHSHADTVARTD